MKLFRDFSLFLLALVITWIVVICMFITTMLAFDRLKEFIA